MEKKWPGNNITEDAKYLTGSQVPELLPAKNKPFSQWKRSDTYHVHGKG